MCQEKHTVKKQQIHINNLRNLVLIIIFSNLEDNLKDKTEKNLRNFIKNILKDFMKKLTLLVTLIMLFALSHSLYSLPPFYYADIVIDNEGELIASYYDSDNDEYYYIYVELRISLYEGNDMIFQQYYEDEYVDEFGYFWVWFGDYYDEAESLWVDIYDIMPSALTRIKVEVRYGRNDWHVVSFKQLSEAVKYNYGTGGGGQGTIIGTNGDMKTPKKQSDARTRSIENMRDARANSPADISSFRQGRVIVSSVPEFDASKGNVFVFTGDNSSLDVKRAKPGQTIFVTNSSDSVLEFEGTKIEKGETYQFLYTGQFWSRVK